MKRNVYIETTIIGHLASRLPRQLSAAWQMQETRSWWQESRALFNLYTSEAVIAEISDGDPQAAAERLAIVNEIPILDATDAAHELAAELIARHALPRKALIDATHLAIAATNGMHYLLTWNCRHSANATLRPIIESTCDDKGMRAPIICTPSQLTEIDHDE